MLCSPAKSALSSILCWNLNPFQINAQNCFENVCWWIMLTFLCWRIWEFWRFHQTKVCQTVPRPSTVSSELICLDSRHQTLAGKVQVGSKECDCLWFSPQSLNNSQNNSIFNYGMLGLAVVFDIARDYAFPTCVCNACK